MSSIPSPTPEQRAEFRDMAFAMAERIVNALEGSHPPFVILEALCLVHKFTVSQLSPHLIGPVAMAMAAYAGELMQADAKGMGLTFNVPLH